MDDVFTIVVTPGTKIILMPIGTEAEITVHYPVDGGKNPYTQVRRKKKSAPRTTVFAFTAPGDGQ